MPPGKRRENYTAEQVKEAVTAVKAGLSLRKASEEYGVPKSTIKDHLVEGHGDTIGRPTVLTEEEEVLIVERVMLLGDWGFPMTPRDLCHFVKAYLDRRGEVTRFKDNLPTYKWVQSFLGRHKVLSERKANPIKRARAGVSRQDVRDFFVHFTKSAEGVAKENMFNYDETNFRDDPGQKKCLFRKGSKYCEKVQNTSKQSFSVMFCGSPAGEMLPPMVVYQAKNIYEGWRDRGPKGTVWSCSKSGWFDCFQFEKWFFECLLPVLRRREGRKLLVGDNLSSHISAAVIEACRRFNIQFVCLPPNSTDKLQPLDVGVFAPLKEAWRQLLTKYKAQHPTQTGIPKTVFPRLLARLLSTSKPGQHLPAAFEKCGLYPVDVEKGVQRIPDRRMACTDSVRELLDSTLGEKLEELRGFNKPKQIRGKKIKVPAGASYTAVEDEEVEEVEEDEEGQEDEGGEGDAEDQEEVVAVRKRRRVMRVESDGDSDDDMELPDLSDDDDDDEEEEDVDEPGPGCAQPAHKVGQFVVAMYDSTWYIAQVEGEEPENECEGFTLLKYMERKGHNQFVWGQVSDQLKTINTDILLTVEPPVPISSRFLGLPKDVVKEVEKLLRVKWSIIWIVLMNFFPLNFSEYQLSRKGGGGLLLGFNFK